jgi:GDP-4-dehydro-6-deoxy-D-mannose reductase
MLVTNMLSQMRRPGVVLLTGALGFVGAHVVEAIQRDTEWTVIGMTHRPSPPAPSDGCRYVVADLTDPSQVRRVVEEAQPHYIIHLAAAIPPAPDDQLFRVNVGGAIALLEAAKAAAPSARVLVVGSDAQYGPQDPLQLPTTEDAPMRPVGPYGRSKVLQEQAALSYRRMADLGIVCVRPFNHIGPGQPDGFVVSSIARQIALAERGLASSTISVGRLDTSRDFTDVRDVARAYVSVMLLGEPGAVYNVGSGVARPIRDVAHALAGAARTSISFRSEPARIRQSDVVITQADSSRLQEVTGWTPGIAFEQTLEDMLRVWRDAVDASGESVASAIKPRA